MCLGKQKVHFWAATFLSPSLNISVCDGSRTLQLQRPLQDNDRRGDLLFDRVRGAGRVNDANQTTLRVCHHAGISKLHPRKKQQQM